MTQKTAGNVLEATVIGWSTAPKRPGMTPCNKVQFYLFAKSPSLLVNLFPKNSKAVFVKCSRTSRWIIHVIVNWIAKLGSKLQWLNRRIFTYDAKQLRFENNAFKKLFPQKPLWRVRCESPGDWFPRDSNRSQWFRQTKESQFLDRDQQRWFCVFH